MEIAMPAPLPSSPEPHTDTHAILPSRRDEHVGADARQFTRRKPRTTLATYCWPRRALDLAKLMNYDVIIITEADFSDDPAFVYPFRANKIEDFEVAVREAIAEWRRYNPNQDFPGGGLHGAS
jgi:hypothetical protein